MLILSIQTTCSSCLKRLRDAFIHRRDVDSQSIIDPQEFLQFSEEIQRALFTFESTSNHAVLRIFRRSDNLSSSESSAFSSLDDNELFLHSGVDESVFLVYL